MALVLAMSVPLVVVVGAGIYLDMQQTIAHTKASLRTLAGMMAKNTGGKIADVRDTLERLANRPLVKRVDPNNCDGILKDLLDLNPEYVLPAYTNIDGEVVCSAVPQPGGTPANVSEAPWFRILSQEQRFTAGNPFFCPITFQRVSVLSVPIRNGRQEVVGSIVLSLDLEAFDPHIPVEYLTPESRYGFLTADGVLVWRNEDPEGLIGTRPKIEAVGQFLALKDGELESKGVDGVLRFFSILPMPDTGWIAWVGVPASEIYAAPRRRAMVAAGVALGVIGLLIFFATFMARRIAGPISALERAAREVQGGDLATRVSISGPGEVVEVANAFNAMTDRIQSTTRQLEEEIDAHWGSEEALRELSADLERQVAQRTERLRELSAELTMTEERERHTLAQELHDNLGQLLALIRMKLAGLGPGSPRSSVDEIAALLEQADQSARTITLELSPPILRMLGLKAGLELLGKEMERTYGLNVRVDIASEPGPLIGELQTALYRCVRELLINVAKHAGSHAASLTCMSDGSTLTLVVSDNGCGFDPAAIRNNPQLKQVLGLNSICERIATLGGNAHIDSSPGNGTTISLSVPLSTLTQK